MLSDSFGWWTVKSPTEIGGTSVGIFLYVDDVDSSFQRALDAGATATMPVETQFWSDRSGSVTDPYGHHWSLATHVEDVAPDEIERRAREVFASQHELSTG
jgi:PhnB protein